MLKNLSIQNLALIKDLEIQLHPGFNVITGQSGAGKSLILSALYLLCGEKASTHLIRTGESKTIITGTFSLTDIEAKKCALPHTKLTIKREITRGSGSKIFINDQKASLEELKTLGEHLFDICHQSDSTFQLAEETQLDILDQFAKLIPQRQEYSKIYQQWDQIRQKLQKTSKLDPNALSEEIDALNHFSPSVEDFEQLEQERLRLENATVIRQTLENCYDQLYSREENSLLTGVAQLKKQIQHILPYGNIYQSIFQQIHEAECFLQEASYALRDQTIEIDENRLLEVQQRLASYKEFFRKYNCSIQGLLLCWNTLKEQYEAIQEGRNEREALERLERELYQQLLQLARNLHEKRGAVTEEFCTLLEKQLFDLGMNCQLQIRVEKNEAQLTLYGISEVEFLISTNKGEELKPLSKIASGGERSRFILALKSLVDAPGIPIFVFDEIDSALGNRFAKEVGQKIKLLSKNHQVLSATHSPILAAYGNHHFLVKKESRGEKTYTKVQVLEGEAKEQELLAMFQGENGPLEIEMLQKILVNQ